MTYNLRQLGIDPTQVRYTDGGRAVRTTCPQCSQNRKPAHRREPVLWVSLETGSYLCHHCGWQGRMDSDEYLNRRQKAPAPSEHSEPSENSEPPLPTGEGSGEGLTGALLTYLTQTRRIPLSVLQQAAVTQATVFMPQTGREEQAIAFQYLEDGRVVNRKYRTLEKHFRMDKGAAQLPYNLDSAKGQTTLIATEGEIDALSFLAAGFQSVISIPNGANAKTDWMNRFFRDYFEDKKTVYIATDTDAPGEQAAQELIRRFGPAVCRRVRFSEGCKDANDELVSHGPIALAQRITEAQPVPLPNITALTDFEDQLNALYQVGPMPGQTTGWKNLDAAITFGPGQLALLTGRSNDGKSEFLDELVLRLMTRSGWNAAYWTPENTLTDHARKLIEKLTGRNFVRKGPDIGLQPADFQQAKTWLQRRVSWVTLPFDQLTLDNILQRALQLVRRNGIRLLVLDPYNFIERETTVVRSDNAWDSYVVGRIRQFAIENDVLVFLVAHPRKVEMQVDGRKRRITIEDISGTADFGNKADYCLCVDRDDDHRYVTVFIDKVRRKQFGTKGRRAFFRYLVDNGRYAPAEVDQQTHTVTQTWHDVALTSLI